MTSFDQYRRQTGDRNFALVIDFLERKFSKTRVQLPDVPCYFYKGSKSKLEIKVLSNPPIAKIDVRIMNIKNFDREPSYECSYDLKGLSISTFQSQIEDLISRMD